MTIREMQPVTDDSCYMAPLHLAGRLIMENGGETYRVEETITRMGRAFGFDEVESFAVPSGIFISYRKSDSTIETAVKRVRKGSIDLTRVDAVNAISRQMEETPLSCEEVMARLQEVERRRPLVGPRWRIAAVAMSAGGWALMFGGGLTDMAVAIVVCALSQTLCAFIDRTGSRSFVSALLGSFLAAILPMACQLLLPAMQVDAAVAACLMPLLPGLAMTNAVQDTLRGDMIAGISSATSAALTATMLACGALLGTTVFRLLTGGGLL